ncbi:MAG TPA: GntR family transcriptional regulator [Nocardioidaceae bacterium]|nr:GntR family transcriptional regulator [Nocardioidaceae bacterium]
MSIVIDTASAVPPYEQLRTQIAVQVASGDLPAGARLATVRQLAADLGLAVNTVARGYRELEADGVIATHGRRGTFVRSGLVEGGQTDKSTTRARSAAQEYTTVARRLGLTQAEATRLVEQSWPR